MDAALVSDCSAHGWFARDPKHQRRNTLWATGAAAVIALATVIVLTKFIGLTVIVFPVVLLLSVGALFFAGRRPRLAWTELGEALAAAGSAFVSALDGHPDALAAANFAHAAATGRSDAAARALTSRSEPLPVWIGSTDDTTVTWQILASFITQGSPYGLKASFVEYIPNVP